MVAARERKKRRRTRPVTRKRTQAVVYARLKGPTKDCKVQLESRALEIDRIQAEWRKTDAAYILALGEELHAARDLLGHRGDGVFGAWLRDRLKVSRTTAYNWMNSYLALGDCPKFVQTFDAGALSMLSRNGVKRWRIEEALALDKKGKRVTRSMALNLVGSRFSKLRERPGDDPEEPGEVSGHDIDPEEEEKILHPPKKTPLHYLKHFWTIASGAERDTFTEWTEERTVETELNAQTGLRTVKKKRRPR